VLVLGLGLGLGLVSVVGWNPQPFLPALAAPLSKTPQDSTEEESDLGIEHRKRSGKLDSLNC
jgi:hypothetical protein